MGFSYSLLEGVYFVPCTTLLTAVWGKRGAGFSSHHPSSTDKGWLQEELSMVRAEVMVLSPPTPHPSTIHTSAFFFLNLRLSDLVATKTGAHLVSLNKGKTLHPQQQREGGA